MKYVGQQKVDEIETLCIRCHSQDDLDKNNRRFDGRVWVDEQRLQIVVTNGRMVPDDTRKGHEDLHPPFMTWRQQIDGHYWFPVYTKGEGILHFSGGYGYMEQDVHIRETVKYTDYKRFGSTSKIFYDGKQVTTTASSPTGNRMSPIRRPNRDRSPAAVGSGRDQRLARLSSAWPSPGAQSRASTRRPFLLRQQASLDPAMNLCLRSFPRR